MAASCTLNHGFGAGRLAAQDRLLTYPQNRLNPAQKGLSIALNHLLYYSAPLIEKNHEMYRMLNPAVNDGRHRFLENLL